MGYDPTDLANIASAADQKALSFYSPWASSTQPAAVKPPTPDQCYAALFPLTYQVQGVDSPDTFETNTINAADVDANLQPMLMLACTNRYTVALANYTAAYPNGPLPSLPKSGSMVTCPDGRQVQNLFQGVDPDIAKCLACGGVLQSGSGGCSYPAKTQPGGSSGVDSSLTTTLLVGGGVALGLYLLFGKKK